MKKQMRALLFTFPFSLLLCSAFAQADDECQLTFSSPQVDFGQIKKEDVVKTQQAWHQISARQINASVHCSEKKVIALFVHANAGEQGRFLFGNGGGIAVRVSQMTVDGRSYNMAKTTDRASFTVAGSASDSLLIHNNEGIVAAENNVAMSGEQMNFTLNITPVLNDSQFSSISDVTTIESDLQWEALTR